MSTNQTNVNSFNRARRDYHAVGKCIPKKDSSQLLLGKPVFTDDITPRDALVIKLLRSPYANAIVEDVKTDIALKVPGMVAVYTWEDVPKKRFSIAGQTFPEPSPYDRLILDRHVRSVGDAVAIVVGESEKAVDKALNMIKVKYTILEPVLDFRKSLDNKVLVHPEDDWSSSINTGDVKRNLIHHEEDEHGNVEKILSECDEIIEHTYRIKAAQQAYMETCRAYCEIDRYGRLHCISSTQIVFHLRRILSNALDIPKSMVRAEKPRIGGGFGAKQTAVCEVYPAFVTWKTKRPSKIIYSRKECQTIASPRHEMEVTVRLGAMRDGHIRAIDLYTLSNGGAYGEHSTTTVGLSGHKSLPLYTGGCEATRFSCDVVYTNVQAAGAYRGYGATQGIFALESTVNELAEKLHIDPVELRLKNIVREGMFMPAYFGETANACALDRCIMHCADNFHWADKYPVRDMGNGKVRAAGKGMRTTCSSKILGNFVPTFTSEAVLNLEKAGAVIIGKTNMDEFAMGSTTETSYYGVTRNPWNLGHVPGGSSGGSCAAVAAGECAYALGSDTGGSIRQPSSFCGVTGIKPTYGTVSRYGLIAYGSSLDQIGPIAKDVTDCATILETIASHDVKDSTSVEREYDFTSALTDDTKGMKIGIPRDYFGDGLSADVKEQILNAVKVLEEKGAVVEEFDLSLVKYAIPAYYIIADAEASSNLARFDGVKYGYRTEEYEGLHNMYKKTRSEGFGAEVKRRIMLGSFVLSSGYYDAYYLKALRTKALIKQAFDKAFAKYDMIVAPAAPTTAPELGKSLSDPMKMYLSDIYTISVNLAGLPGISIPVGKDSKGLPIGMQLIGDCFQEKKIIQAAYTFEQTRTYEAPQFVKEGR